jgi:hypothetical protein
MFWNFPASALALLRKSLASGEPDARSISHGARRLSAESS